MQVKTIGFPVIHNFPGDIREFTPNLFKYLDKFKEMKFYLEKGYGNRLGYVEDDYHRVNDKVEFVEKERVYKQDLITVLKNPDLEDLENIKDGSALFTMIHYDTRPAAVELITRKKIRSFSMDSIVDDYGGRMFVDYLGTAFSGCQLAFEELKKSKKDFYSKNRTPIKITVVGAGGVGQGVVKSFEILSDKEFLGSEYTGAVTSVVTRTITDNEPALEKIIKETDILVDASKRGDYSKPIISNKMLGNLPEDAIILDLSADRYDTTTIPPMVRAFEGTVKGSPEEKIIYPNDHRYDEVPDFIDTTNRRIVVSCDAWPSADPHKSIAYYEVMMKSYLNVLLNNDVDQLDINSDNIFERGLYRSTIKYFLENKK